MTGRQWTLCGLGVAGAILAAVEANALADSEPGNTISARAADAIERYPAVAGLMSAPVVHFCTPTMTAKETLPWWRGATVAIVGGVLLGLAWPRRDPSKAKKL